MPILVDAHEDLAWNILTFKRDYTRSAVETQLEEAGSPNLIYNGNTLLGWEDYQRGQTAIVFSTLFVSPQRKKIGEWDSQAYHDFDEAYRKYSTQLDTYHLLTENYPDKYKLILNRNDLEEVLTHWTTKKGDHPVGLVILMEGAEGIRNPSELNEWWSRGVRIIGPAWGRTRYCGGTNEPGPLTDDGHNLFKGMAEFGITLDLSHMDELAARKALDDYASHIIVSHANCAALFPHYTGNRMLSDDIIKNVIKRDGIIGLVPILPLLKQGWIPSDGRSGLTLESIFVEHIDHVCQLAGNARHAGIGTDYDGGCGVESSLADVDTIADLQKLDPILSARGYSKADIEAILGEELVALPSGEFTSMKSNENLSQKKSNSVSNGTLNRRIRFGLIVTLIGLFIFLVGARPAWFGWDRSVVVGFVQIAVFLIGLAIISFGGYICLITFWTNGHRTIAADIGLRLVSTGYVVAVFSGMADVFGMGSQSLPAVPFFGPMQSLGVQIGEATIAIGFSLLIPYQRLHSRDSFREQS